MKSKKFYSISKRSFRIILLSVFLLLLGVIQSWGATISPVNGDLRIHASANSNSISGWDVYNGSTWAAVSSSIPFSTTASVFVQSGMTLSVGTSFSCKNLYVSVGTTSASNTAPGAVACGSYVITVAGAIEAYWGTTVTTATGALPAATLCAPTAAGGFNITSGTGSITFTGSSPTVAGGWSGLGTTTWTAIFNPSGLSAALGTDFSCTTLTVSSSCTLTNAYVLTVPTLLTVTGTLTNNGTVTATTALSGTGTFTNNNSASILNIGGTSGISTLTASTSGNTVNYTGAGQTPKTTTYHHLTFSGSGSVASGSITTVNGNLTLAGTVTYATNGSGGSLTIGGNLNIGDGTTLSTGTTVLTVNGTTTVGGGTSGILLWASASGAKLFKGLVTINAGGLWNEGTYATAPEFRGGITNNGTFTASTGTHTFSTNSQTLTGTFSIPSVTVSCALINSGTLTCATLLTVGSGYSLTNSGTVTATTALSGSGSFIQGTTGYLYLGGTSGISTLTATAVGNTVNYSGASGQTIPATSFSNLIFSGAGTKTMTSSSTTTIAGAWTVGSTTSVPSSSTIVNVTGNWANNATTTIASSSGSAINVTGNISGSGAITFSGSGTISIAGTWSNGGAFTCGTGTVNFNGSGAQNIPTLTFNNLTASTSSTTKTINGTVTVGGVLTVNSSVTLAVISPYTLSINGASPSHTISGSVTVANGATLDVSGASTWTSSSNAFTISGIMSFSRVGAQTLPDYVTISSNGELILSNSGAKTLGYNPTINGILSLQGTATVSSSSYSPIYGSAAILEYKGSSAQTASSYEWPTSSGPHYVTINNSAGVTLNGNRSISGTLSLMSGAFYLTGSNTLTFNGTSAQPITTSGGTITTAATYSLSFSPSSTPQTWTLPASIFTSSPTTFQDLSIAMGSGGSLTLNSQDIILGGTSTGLYLSSGLLNLGTGNIQVAYVYPYYNYSSSLMVVTSPTSGYFKHSFATGSSDIIYPIGENTGTAEYSGFDFTLNTNTVSGRIIGFKVIDAAESNYNTPTCTNYLTRYWMSTVSNTTGSYTYSANMPYNGSTGDIVGTESYLTPEGWNGSAWVPYEGTVNTSSDYLSFSGATSAASPLGYDITGRKIDPPANDECANATLINPDATCTGAAIVNGSVVGATNSGVSSSVGTADDDVWFKFVAEATTQYVTLTNIGGTDLVTQFLSGTCGGSWTSKGYYDTDPSNQAWTGLTSGTTYYIRVYSYGSTPISSGGTFTLCVTNPPANDECSGAVSLTVNSNSTCTSTTSGTTTNASQSQSGCSGTADDDVWYKFTATSTSHVVTVTPGTMQYAVLQVFSGSCGSLASLGCQYNTSTASAAVSVNLSGLTIGNTYYVRTYSYYSGSSYTGTFTMCVTTPPVNDACSGAVSLTVGGATVQGTWTGSTPTSGSSYNDVWYSFSTCGSGNHTITINGFSTSGYKYLYLYTACTTNFGDYSYVASSGGNSTTSETLTFNCASGTIYYVLVQDYSGGGGTFNVAVTGPVPGVTLDNTGAPSAGGVSIPTSNAVLFGFKLNPVCSTSLNFTGVTVTNTGTAGTSDISNLRIYQDVNSNGTFESGTDVLVSGTGLSVSGSIVFTITGQTGISAARKYLLVADVASGATPGNTFIGKITPSTNISATITPSGSVNGTATGNTMTLTNWFPCSQIQSISGCGVSVTSNTTGTGAWDVTACSQGAWTTPGKEIIYTFTPPTTGTYSLQVTSANGTGTTWLDYFYKPVSDGCSGTGWTCIVSSGVATTGTYGSFTLTGGVQYYIMTDPEQVAITNQTFNIPFLVPTITSFTPSSGCANVTPVSITGTNFTGATGVTFGGVNASSFTVNSSTSITATPAGGTTGTISVTTATASGTSSVTFTVYTIPTVTANAPTDLNCNDFTANWTAVSGTSITYYLDVATDANFNNFVSGFNNLSMGNVTSYPVTGLPQNITYYYRVRVNVTVNSCTGTSVNSNTISVSPTLHTNIAAYSNVFNETFGTGSSLPTGWSSTLTDWAVNSTSPSSGAGHYTGNSGDNNVWTNNPVETNASLYAPVVNFSGYTNGKLTFGLRKTSGFSRDLEIAVSLDNFATNAFTQTIHNADQPSDTWGLETIYLGNAIDNAASVYIRFRIPGTPVTGASSTIRIDDVILSSATPTITASGTLCTGGSITLTSSAGSTYLWSPTNETTQSINVTSAGTYSVQINGCVNSAPAVVTGQSTSDAPVITGTYCSGATTVSGTGVDGSTINVIRGGSSIGSTTVSGTTWSVNGLTLAASDALTATQLTPTKCVSAASTPAVTVQDITSAPVVSSTICDVATTVSGTSEPGASIIVYKAGSTQIGTATADGNGNWTTGTLSPAITTGDNITATATASGKCISIASSPAVTVILCCTAPSITGQPVDPAAVCPGTNSSDFSVTAAGTSPTYKWQRGISGTYVDISAATTPSDGCTYSNYSTATLTVANAPIGMNGYTYQCIVHGACGDDVTSDAKTLTVNTTPSAPSGSTSQSFCSSASHTVGDLTNAIGTAIQWYAASSGGTALSGSTALVDGTHYYASQTVSGCESNSRLDVTVTLNPASAGGFAALPQTICYSSSPADISLLGSTGNIQWQSSPDNSTWINISGATANPLTSAQMGPLTATTYYRAIVTSGVCTDVASTSVKVTVGPAINYGTASNTLGGANTQTICYNTSPASMSASGASGSSSFSYQWFSQTGAVTPTAGDNSGWTSAPGTGHNTATFSAPTAITGTTTFACWVTPGCGSANWAGASNNDNIQVTVDPAFSGGTLANNTQSICYNTQPSDITYSTPPAGGTTPTFQWYYLAGSHTTPSGVFSQGLWTAIGSPSTSTPTLAGSTIGTLTTTTTFALRVYDGGSSACFDKWAGNAQIITVGGTLSGGTLTSTTQTSCYNTNPSDITYSAAPGGGSNPTFQWYYLAGNQTAPSGAFSQGLWTAVGSPSTSSPTLAGSTIGNLTSTTTFALEVYDDSPSSCFDNWAGNAQVITIDATFSAGTINSVGQTICNNTQPSSITYSTAPTGGTVTTFQWYYLAGSQTAPSGTFSQGAWTAIGSPSTTTPTLTGVTIGNLTGTTTFALKVYDGGSANCFNNWNGDCHIVTVRGAHSGGTLASSTQSICHSTQPSDITYSTPPSGGTSLTYQWYTQTGTVAAPSGNWSLGSWTAVGSSGSSPTLLGTTIGTLSTPGTYTYALRATDGGGTTCFDVWNGDRHVITVYPDASMGTVTGTTPLCILGQATYSANPVVLGGGTGVWSSDNTSATVDPSTGVVTAVASGTCNIKFTITGGCNTSPSGQQALTINQNAQISGVSGTTPLCVGASATYTTSGAILDGGTGSWSSTATGIATVDQSGVVTGVVPGSCYIEYTISGCGGNPSAKQKVTILPDASISSVTGTSPLCVGGSATYTANTVVLSGGTGSWSSDNTNVATISTSGVVTCIAAGSCNIVYTINGGCNGTQSAQQTLTVNNNTWLGGHSTNWNDASNWCNGIPTSTSDIVIPSGTTYSPHVTSSPVTAAICHNLTINSGAVLTVDAGKAFTVNGTTTLTDPQCLVLKAASGQAAGGSGSFIDNGITGSGTAKVEKYLSQGRYWYIGSPIVSIAASDAYGTLSTVPSTGTRDFYWKETTHAYVALVNTDILQPTRGYAFEDFGSSPITATYIGNLNTGSITANLTYTSGTKQGFNLVSNPYPSAINWGSQNSPQSGLTQTNLEQTIQYKVPGTYATWNSMGSGTGVNGGGQYIPAMQAFWVRVAAGNTTGSIQFTNAIRVHSAQAAYKLGDPPNVFRMQVARDTLVDESVVTFYAAALGGFEDYDSPKMLSDEPAYPQLYSYTTNAVQVAVNGQPVLVTGVERIIPLGFLTNVAGNFKITATNLAQFDANTTVYLEDTQIPATVNLSSTKTYTFASNAGTFNSRFKLHFNKSTSALPIQLLSFDAKCMNNNVDLNWSTATEMNNDYFTVERSTDAATWNFVKKVSGAGNSNSVLNYTTKDADPLKGISYYRLKQTDYNGQSESFNAVAVNCDEESSQVNITYYPNPFTSEVFAVINNSTSENATVNVYNIFGSKVYSKNISHEELELKGFSLNLENVADGIYFVEFKSDSYSGIEKIVKN